MRCLALAHGLREAGSEVSFACREAEGDLNDLIGAQGFRVHRLPRMASGDVDPSIDAAQTLAALEAGASFDWLIVDHYRLNANWEGRARSVCDKLMVIDDLADRRHDCDLLLDQNYCDGMDGRYRGLVATKCRQLSGPDFALLRTEFLKAKAGARQRNGELKRMLVFFGGSDPTDETSKALKGIAQLGRGDIAVDVVVGSSNPQRHAVQTLCRSMQNVVGHVQVSNMAELMAQSDLAIGGGGVTTWERCCLGLPALVAILAENQAPLTKAVDAYGAIENLGWADRLNAADYCSAIEKLTPSRLLDMGHRGATLVDGRGCERVVREMQSLLASKTDHFQDRT
ncbi:UDP-2,4-diacetamido-2,4,6-trideoxy-beta-L-altropyranose hydrolase [soil metagenome]